ncbi:hypothetical protein BHE74_00048449 [Ensete ventricosum]|nr:hypothetical protein GW17_00039522 [Ensete ventricosum]RWW45690.1 hypothetical protein BHE74_00048449 [Ensete ventricosum]
MNYVASHGEGQWNSVARCAEQARAAGSGGSITSARTSAAATSLPKSSSSSSSSTLAGETGEQRPRQRPLNDDIFLNVLPCRWSKIAQYLPGRTDNEIKNYWRTRVEKQAKLLRCDVDSQQFKDMVRYMWMPRLAERILAASGGSSAPSACERPAEGSVELGRTPETQFASVSATGGSASSTQGCDVVTASESVPSPGACDGLGSLDWEESLWNMEEDWSQQEF